MNWLSQRQMWLSRVSRADSDTRPLSNQQWRDCLGGLREKSRASTRAGKRRAQVTQLLGDFAKESGLVKDTSESQVFWKERLLVTVDTILPDRKVVQEILWELYELNFRFEFLALDRRANNSPMANQQSELNSRQDDLMACFMPSKSNDLTFFVTEIPERNGGLAADSWHERLAYLLAMHKVMTTWDGTKPEGFGLGNRGINSFTEKSVELLEEAIATFYTQSFFDYFGRAATVPHKLPF
jgi:hypothetical protein